MRMRCLANVMTVLVGVATGLPARADRPWNGPEVNGTCDDEDRCVEGFASDLALGELTKAINATDTHEFSAMAIVDAHKDTGARSEAITLRARLTFSDKNWVYPDTSNAVCGACRDGGTMRFYDVEVRRSTVPDRATGKCSSDETESPTGGCTSWQPLCQGGRPAVLAPWGLYDKHSYLVKDALAGKFRYAFACPGSALYECASEWGYPASESRFQPPTPLALPARAPSAPAPPIRIVPPPIRVEPLDPFRHTLAACVRAVRGDYCGTYESLTVVHTPLLVVRGEKPKTAASASGSEKVVDQFYNDEPEAVWDDDGAKCVSKRSGAMRLTHFQRTRSTLLATIEANCKRRVREDCVPGKDELATYGQRRPMGICFARTACTPALTFPGQSWAPPTLPVPGHTPPVVPTPIR